MAVREIGMHAAAVVYRGKTWVVAPDEPFLSDLAEAVELQHRVDRNATKILRLEAEMRVLEPRVDAAKAAVDAAELEQLMADGALAGAILFKSGERAAKEHADHVLRNAKRTFQALLTTWNPMVVQVKALRADPARWLVKSTLRVWSYDWRLYQITGIQPDEAEAKTLILQYLARRQRELERALEELAPGPARAVERVPAPAPAPEARQRVRGPVLDPSPAAQTGTRTELVLSAALAPYRSIVLAFFEAAEPKVARSDMAGEKRYDRLEGEIEKCLRSIATRMGLLTRADFSAWRKGHEGRAFDSEIEARFIEWFERRTAEDRVPATFTALDDEAFEVHLRDVFIAAGYEVAQPPATRDKGADLIAKKDGRKVVVQAKRWGKNVDVKVIGEVLTAKSYYRADDAWVITTSDFSADTKDAAHHAQVRLIAGHELRRLRELLGGPAKVAAAPVPVVARPAPPKVPTEARLVCDDAVYRAEYVVVDGFTWTLGRERPADFLVTHLSVSRTHAFFKMESGKLLVSDNASTSGTFVNGRRLEPKQWFEVIAGEKLYVGALCLRVVF